MRVSWLRSCAAITAAAARSRPTLASALASRAAVCPSLLSLRRSLHCRSTMAAPASSASHVPPHEASTTPAAMAAEQVPSLSTTSVWQADAGARSSVHPPLQGDAGSYDVIVVGGGIVGVSAAYELAKAGQKVALVEARTVGTGTTGWSTAKLTAQQNLLYTTLAAQHGKETARLYGQMNLEAITHVETLDRELGLQCAFQRQAHATWTSVAKIEPLVQAEAELCKQLGLPCDYLTGEEVKQDLPASIEPKNAVLFRNQAAFNPIKFCVGLAGHVAKFPGCAVFENSRVTEVTQTSPHTVTLDGGKVHAKHVILATHLPILDRSLHFTMHSPSRTVCISVKLSDPTKLPKHMWISDSSTPMRSLRVSEGGDLVVAGESFDQGNVTDTNAKYRILEEWTREHFPVERVTQRWSSMDYISSTHLPFVGYLMRGTSTLYCATAFSKWGLANGVAAGPILRDLVLQGESALESNAYAKMLDARRWDLMKSSTGMMKAGLHTAYHMVGDKVKAALSGDIKHLKRGEGAICKIDGQQVGAYLDPEGKYHLVKPVCTHLGCDVVFNQGEPCWDCPCHGSQFTIDGDVIQGPACKKLESMNHLNW